MTTEPGDDVPTVVESTEGDDEDHHVPAELLDLYVALEAQEAGLL